MKSLWFKFKKVALFIITSFFIAGCSGGGGPSSSGIGIVDPTRNESTITQLAFIKASNPDISDAFGGVVSISDDGNTLVVSATGEKSNATRVGGDQTDNSIFGAGAVYVFERIEGVWTQQAYLKSRFPDSGNRFGSGLAISGDGNTIVVGEPLEDNGLIGVDGTPQKRDRIFGSGAVFIFVRNGDTWIDNAYIKASNIGRGNIFGTSVALSDDGKTLAVGAPNEGSLASGIDGDQTNVVIGKGTGAAYIFARNNGKWQQTTYIKASNPGKNDRFGESVALSGFGNRLAIGAPKEDSAAVNLNGDETDNSAIDSGAVYVYNRRDGKWSQDVYIKASNTDAGDEFGSVLTFSNSGRFLAVMAPFEKSNALGVNGDQSDNSLTSDGNGEGAVYVYEFFDGLVLGNPAYLKTPNTDINSFSHSVAISGDGNTILMGFPNTVTYSRVFESNSWTVGFVIDNFINGTVHAINGDGKTLATGWPLDQSGGVGISGSMPDRGDISRGGSGAVYVYKIN